MPVLGSRRNVERTPCSARSETSQASSVGSPRRTVSTVSLYQALAPAQHLSDGFFDGRIVFIGLSEPATEPTAKDTFLTPFSRGPDDRTHGVEIHATIAANLMENRKIRPLSGLPEAVLLLLVDCVVPRPIAIFALRFISDWG